MSHTTAKPLSYGAEVTGLAAYARRLSISTSRKVTVAVVDSGIRKHSYIRSRLLRGYDFVDMDTNPKDGTGHGTHVAGIIVDSTPTLNIRILPVRVFDNKGAGYNSVIGLGVRYAAEKGARVINLSLGGDHSAFLENCIRYAVTKGCVVCLSAGNENQRMKKKSNCPGHMDGKGILTVGAVTPTLARAGFSNYGKSLDIMAPGQSIYSTYFNGNYTYMSGTSMATPYVSAAAAIYRLEHPSYSPTKIRKMILNSTVDKGSSGRDDYYGVGVLKMPAN